MFTAKSIISLIAVVFLVTLNNSFSQGKTSDRSSSTIIKQTGDELNTDPVFFRLYNSIRSEDANVKIIKFELGEDADVNLSVYDSYGNLIETLISDKMEAGIYNVNYKSREDMMPDDLTYKLEVISIGGIKNIFTTK